MILQLAIYGGGLLIFGLIMYFTIQYRMQKEVEEKRKEEYKNHMYGL